MKNTPDAHLSYKKLQQPSAMMTYQNKNTTLPINDLYMLTTAVPISLLRVLIRTKSVSPISTRLLLLRVSTKRLAILSGSPGLYSVSPMPSNIFQTSFTELPNSSIAINFELSQSKIRKAQLTCSGNVLALHRSNVCKNGNLGSIFKQTRLNYYYVAALNS